MYAWLTDMLDYYMSATGDVHVEKYLKLLGVEPKEGCPAGGYVVVEGLPEGTVLPAGTRFLAGTIPYETIRDYEVRENRFIAFFNEADGMLTDMTAFAGKDGDYAEGFSGKFNKEQQSGSALKNRCFRGMVFISAWKRMSGEILLTTPSGCATSFGRFIQSRAGWK